MWRLAELKESGWELIKKLILEEYPDIENKSEIKTSDIIERVLKNLSTLMEAWWEFKITEELIRLQIQEYVWNILEIK
jgi:hypothetical protein